MFEVTSTPLDGCLKLLPRVIRDHRGHFVKTFHTNAFRDRGLCIDFVEEYYTVSRKNVIRGLHFQTPPHDHTKIVFCASGAVFDAVVDIRKGSPTYGKHCCFKLTSEIGSAILIPPGFAHGFCALTHEATMAYKVTSFYNPTHDTGILWNSANIDWPLKTAPVLSKRDASFNKLCDFNSPFVYIGDTYES